MKKLILTVALVLGVAATSTAQEKGGMWLGGSLSVGSTSYKVGDADSDNNFTFSVMPEFGYNLSDRIAIGIYGGVEYMKPKDVDAAVGYVIAPFARYYATKWDVVNIFSDLNVYYKGGDYGALNIEDDYAEFGVGIRPGISVKLSDTFAFHTKIGYLGYTNISGKDAAGEKVKSNDFGLKLDMSQIQFGVSFTF